MIKPQTKEKVWERDGQCCIWCGSHDGQPNAHYISRSRLGMGIEENILTLCPRCHRVFDQPGTDREVEESRKMSNDFRRYLCRLYPGWAEDKVIYRKG